MEKQFTASVVIIHEGKTLLLHHRKLQKWLPPGGHIEPNETPPEAARREAFEETGLDVKLIAQENIWVNYPNARSIERPYLSMLQEIPEHKGVAAHQHIDLVYVASPVGGKVQENVIESSGLRWFTLEQVEALKLDVDIFPEVQVLIRHLLST